MFAYSTHSVSSTHTRRFPHKRMNMPWKPSGLKTHHRLKTGRCVVAMNQVILSWSRRIVYLGNPLEHVDPWLGYLIPLMHHTICQNKVVSLGQQAIRVQHRSNSAGFMVVKSQRTSTRKTVNLLRVGQRVQRDTPCSESREWAPHARRWRYCRELGAWVSSRYPSSQDWFQYQSELTKCWYNNGTAFIVTLHDSYLWNQGAACCLVCIRFLRLVVSLKK